MLKIKSRNMTKDIKYEPVLWLMPSIFIIGYFIYTYGSDSFFSPSLGIELTFCFTPLFFAILFKIVYDKFPLSYLIYLLEKRK